jgi:dTDP-4-dehydrorhamnose 3,5-epimerase
MTELEIPDIKIFTLDPFVDHRGEIYTFWSKKVNDFNLNFVQDKFTFSHKNVMRGIHGDFESHKFATCVFGEVFYVFVDNRKDSPTYMKWLSLTLSQQNKLAVLFPPGIGSAALTLSENSVTAYKLAYQTDYPDLDKQFSIKWNSENLNIKWPINQMILSERDL